MCDSVGKLLRNGVRGRSAVAAREKQANKGGMITYLDPASSFISDGSSLILEPLTATLLLGGARSSAPPMAGLFLSSILESVDGRGEAAGDVATGMRRRVQQGLRRGARGSSGRRARLRKGLVAAFRFEAGRAGCQPASRAELRGCDDDGGRRRGVRFPGVEISKLTRESRGTATAPKRPRLTLCRIGQSLIDLCSNRGG